MKTFDHGLSRRGSALLIVLGFLSFMMVSAVSFAIYMRIERQASSNYRHAAAARHMLNAALFRAIDEIDGELRIQQVNSESEARPRKFPEWPGRTKPSAVANGLDNGEEARVLSMESLSFIPGVFVNDVRRYAVSNQNDKVSGVSLANNRFSYLGTKWRKLSMPVSSLGAGASTDVPNAYEEAIVGRYAYLCVNVSDMLDVNVCKAAIRDSVTNRVSLGQFFGPNSQNIREAFDDYVEDKGLHFDTLQDFYACMYNNASVAPTPANASPYHDYMKAGSSSSADAGFDEAGNHVFISDSRAKAQPANATACNILLQPPIAASALTAAQVPSVTFQNTSVQGRDGFETALGKAFAGRLPAGANVSDVFPLMLADYIDEDSIPKALNMPSVEIVPMVSQILVPQFFQPRIMEKIDPVQPNPPPPTPNKIFYLNAVPVAGPQMMQIQVEVVWPYKRLQDRACPVSSDYDVEVLAYLKLHSTAKQSDGFNTQPSVAFGYLKLTGTVKAPNFSGKNDDNQNECYRAVLVPLTAVNGTTLDFAINNGTGALAVPLPDYTAGQPFYVSLVVCARIKKGNIYVDSAPQGALSVPGANSDQEFAQFTRNKLYFQTAARPFIPVGATVPGNGISLTFDWTSLEVPDPRFNYKAANWIVNASAGAAGSIPANDINPTTTALLGKDGRDGDIFMSVSDAGELQSPGELGFILRPFKYDMGIGASAAVDFRTRSTSVDPNLDDSAAYFRTVRLYDQDNSDASDKVTKAQDPIYQYITAQNADGSVPGARVNPLSDLPQILTVALDQTPADYWFASRDGVSDKAIMRKNTYNKYLSNADWNKFTNAWSQCFLNFRKTAQGQQMRAQWKYGLSDYYGDFDKFGWYSAGDPLTIFSPKGYASATVPASLSTQLHEIDRKMLYSFSLDSFSDRQQLFLYILRAEVTVPSFGSSQESGVKSLAGGRAVALVWRDPYPEGYDKASDSWTTGDWYTYIKRVSPWYQVNLKQYEDDLEENETAGDPSFNTRFNAFHQHKILYFKQLDN